MINIHDVYYDHEDEDDDVKKRVKCLVGIFVPTLCVLSSSPRCCCCVVSDQLSASKSVQSYNTHKYVSWSYLLFYTLRRSLAKHKIQVKTSCRYFIRHMWNKNDIYKFASSQIFFVLRKKTSQVSTLHVIHHGVMPMSGKSTHHYRLIICIYLLTTHRSIGQRSHASITLLCNWRSFGMMSPSKVERSNLKSDRWLIELHPRWSLNPFSWEFTRFTFPLPSRVLLKC